MHQNYSALLFHSAFRYRIDGIYVTIGIRHTRM